MKKEIVQTGRTIKQKTKTKIHAASLQVGMYICELDKPWEDTPFLFQGFKVESEADIDTVLEYCEYVVVEVDVDTWLPAVERTINSGPKTRPRKRNKVAAAKEYENASSAYNNARQLTKSVLDDIRLGNGINTAEVKKTVSECVKSVIRNPETMMWLSRIRQRDDYTAEHSVNVGLLAIGYGRHLGLCEEDLNKVGFAGMMHDVGKMHIPLEILNKPQRLTDEESVIMRSHPITGRDLLMSHKDIYHGVIDVAYGHHENIDGTGYPRKIKASGVSEFTRLVTLCDVYDAITADRCYKKGASSVKALRILFNQRGTLFDTKMTNKFIEYVGLYPPGSIALLRNGEVAIVVASNYKYHQWPQLMLILDENKNERSERMIDIARLAKINKQEPYLIREILPNGAFGIRIEKYIKKGLKIT